LRSTNAIESMISIARTHSANVKNWQNGTMALRWCAAGMLEASKQFRRVNAPPAPTRTTHRPRRAHRRADCRCHQSWWTRDRRL